ncbi:equilibrative nucleoside transporter 1 [Anopheles funestus]|uniref:Equilibrative nucleoside transporter n=1 Tax=Anopheles funestus TaxID=62324 RepID=A0A182R9N5_ANOFN|nr:equilibrative nucleoside transporter 1 [Anopheles funestus]XP_049281560.1 equilibrative nucleoside transporter 1 [Anopheles funestus]
MVRMDFATNVRPLLQDTDDRETESDALIDDVYAGSINASTSNIPDSAKENATETRIIAGGHRIAPTDKFNYTYVVFYLMGMTTMVPWNFFVTAEEYWQYKFRNVSSNDTSALTPRQLEFQSDLSIAAAVPGTVFLILNACIGHKVPLHVRMNGSLVFMLLIMIGTTALVRVDTDQWQDAFFNLTMLSVVVINSFSAILTGGLFGIAGQFSAHYMTAAVSGQALGGIFSAVADIIALTFASNPSTTAFVFFIVGCLVLLLSLVAYIVMSKTLFFKYYTCSKTLMKSSLEADPSTREMCARLEPRFPIVMRKIWIYGFSEWLVFVTTLSIYPAVTVLVGSQNHGRPWNDVYFLPVVNYLLFNTGDYLGRVFAGLFEWPWNNSILIGVLTISRIAFVPAMLLCNITQHHNFPVLIHSDYMFIVLMAAFALSNGYLANIALIGAPRVVDGHEKEMASSMMAAFLGVGLACGSAISLMIIEMIK